MGLALLVSVDFHVPLLWKVYPGNQHDSLTFSQVLQELTDRYRALARDCPSITLVFDKGNNSARHQEILDASGFHFVGSLVPTHYADLLAIPLRKFRPLNDPRLKPTLALHLSREVLSLPSLLQSLARIQEVTNIYPATGGSRARPRVETTLTEMDATQQTLYRLFALDRYRQGRFLAIQPYASAATFYWTCAHIRPDNS